MSAQIEFKTQSLYHQHKRNALFITAVLLIVWSSHPGSTIPIPGTGTQVQVRTTAAFTMMTIAILYTSWLFAVEWLGVRQVNLSAVVRTGKKDIDGAISDILGQIASGVQDLTQGTALRATYVDPVRQLEERLQQVVELKAGTDSLIVGIRSHNNPVPITLDDFKNNYQNLCSTADGLTQQVKAFIDEQAQDSKRAADGVEKALSTFEDLKNGLNRISGSISWTQRWNFYGDIGLVVFCALASVFMTVCEFLGRVPPF